MSKLGITEKQSKYSYSRKTLQGPRANNVSKVSSAVQKMGVLTLSSIGWWINGTVKQWEVQEVIVTWH